MFTVSARGVLKRLETWSIVLPLHDNEGRRFAPSVISGILERLSLEFPGLYLLTWPVGGDAGRFPVLAGLTPGRAPAIMSACRMRSCVT